MCDGRSCRHGGACRCGAGSGAGAVGAGAAAAAVAAAAGAAASSAVHDALAAIDHGQHRLGRNGALVALLAGWWMGGS
ncbi:hypothetical protein ON010_g1888 [Phytophthora cinnamomi]|nr:hypothetical protein ON010_g1888 [Phytophthora cinnamomi]